MIINTTNNQITYEQDIDYNAMFISSNSKITPLAVDDYITVRNNTIKSYACTYGRVNWQPGSPDTGSNDTGVISWTPNEFCNKLFMQLDITLVSNNFISIKKDDSCVVSVYINDTLYKEYPMSMEQKQTNVFKVIDIYDMRKQINKINVYCRSSTPVKQVYPFKPACRLQTYINI